jgi:hypothetical protein
MVNAEQRCQGETYIGTEPRSVTCPSYPLQATLEVAPSCSAVFEGCSSAQWCNNTVTRTVHRIGRPKMDEERSLLARCGGGAMWRANVHAFRAAQTCWRTMHSQYSQPWSPSLLCSDRWHSSICDSTSTGPLIIMLSRRSGHHLIQYGFDKHFAPPRTNIN